MDLCGLNRRATLVVGWCSAEIGSLLGKENELKMGTSSLEQEFSKSYARVNVAPRIPCSSTIPCKELRHIMTFL